MSESKIIDKFDHIVSSEKFLFISCTLIFCLSIFLRSIIDIGPDTGIYLDLGRKIAEGKRYYYDFFESNFPLSFWIYALQFRLSNWSGINPIIMSEIVINSLALLSISWSAQILKKTTIYNNRAHYNLVILAYFVGFFLRSYAIQLGEFGTKSSFLLICLFPYISFSFERLEVLKRGALMQRGILMGLIPCFKPHYLVFVIFIEAQRFLQKRSLRFFVEIDKLVMLAIGSLYLFLMLKFTPEFLEFIVPMWPKVYRAYDDVTIFFSNAMHRLGAQVVVNALIFLVFSRLRFTANDKILFLIFCAASVLVVLENIGTIDQVGVVYAVYTICFLKIFYDIILSHKFSLRDNKVMIIVLAIWPLSDMTILPWVIVGISGFINVWWLIFLFYPLIFCYKLRKSDPQKFVEFRKQNLTAVKIFAFIFLYLFLLLLNVISFKYMGGWGFMVSNISSLFFVLFFFERFYAAFSEKFSSFLVFVVTVSASCLFYTYFYHLSNLIPNKHYDIYPNKLSDQMAYYSSIYAPQKRDGILVISDVSVNKFPLLNYLGKENYYVGNVVSLRPQHGFLGASTVFPQNKDRDTIFTLSYLFEEFKKQLQNKDVKILFFNNRPRVLTSGKICTIGFLEYYFYDPELRKIFFENFRFKNHILTFVDSENPTQKIMIAAQEKRDVFDHVELSSKVIRYDVDVYVRKE